MITIIDYDAGNLTSVKRALDHLGIANQITSDPTVALRSDRIIFPGVGAAGAAMTTLKKRGLDRALVEAYRAGILILGICIGCQIILEYSEEDDTPCLGLLPGQTVRFRLSDPALKIPHMGWNAVTVTQPHFILRHLRPGDEFYFVHSFYPQPAGPAQVFATSEYENPFPVAIGSGHLFAVQFHAEKSGPPGLGVLENFARWQP